VDPFVEKLLAALNGLVGKGVSSMGAHLEGTAGAVSAGLPDALRPLVGELLAKAQAVLKPAVETSSTPAEQASPALPVLHLTAPQVRKLASLDKAALAALVGA